MITEKKNICPVVGCDAELTIKTNDKGIRLFYCPVCPSCPRCKIKMREDVMPEEGVNHSVKICDDCGFWR